MKNRQRLRHTRLMCGAAVAALAIATGAQAQTRISIAPQPLDTALNELGAQGNQQVLIRSDVATGKMTRGVSDAPSFEVALGELLQGTGLTWRREGETFLIVSATDPQPGSAAGDGAEGTVEALIVTAQKREEDIQDVPIAISAFTQETLERSQVAGGPDLMTQVPNMTFTKTNFSSYSIQLRGIGTQAISATTDAAVAVTFNNTPFIRNNFFEQEFYDLERVEVLRGPQGTLYGRNATAGVVNVISAKPRFGFEARVSADVANFHSTRLEGMVNVPLVEDMVAMRLAAAWTKRDGYATNELTGNPIDGRDLWSTRVSLRFSPSDSINANLIWEHFEEDDDRLRSGKQLCKTDKVTNVGGIPIMGEFTNWANPGNDLLWSRPVAVFARGCEPASLYSPDSFGTPNGLALPYYVPLGSIGLPIALDDPYVSRTQSSDLRVIESARDPGYQAQSDIFELQLGLDLTDTLTLSLETGYSAHTIFSTQDFNRFNTAAGAWEQTSGGLLGREDVLTPGPNGGIFCDPQIGCSDRLVAVDLSQAEARQFSQELRLGSNYEGPFNFSLGANFLRYDNEDKYYVFVNSLTMIAALAPYGTSEELLPYVVGDDNAECLMAGLIPPDFGQIQDVGGCTYIDPNPIGNLNDKGHNYFLSKNPYKLISYAVFGETYYELTDNLKVTAGVRWTVDKKEAPRIPSWVLAEDTVGYPVVDVIEQEWREPTGRLAIDWKPDLSLTDETLVYASIARGYKAGGANPPPAGPVMYCSECGAGSDSSTLGPAVVSKSATHPKTFDPEFINAFELGSKNTLLDGRLTLNLAAFYYDYTGYQISQIVNRSAVNLNFDSEVWGLEIEADWRPFENLRLGFKGGYENTRVADGMKAVDIMDRTAGDPNWIVVKPFPTFPSNCIMPVSLFVRPDGNLYKLGNAGGGGAGPCELAYVLGLDPLTEAAYNPNTHITNQGFSASDPYLGFDPFSAHNFGEGIDKDLSGNELPNAPNFTATITADYTIPLPNDWLATLHTDLYYQSEAWTRIFNTEGYDKLKAYTNVNLAAIFTNDDRGWKVMTYVKNVFDRDSITGAFLNSDDTGLTTNVFLTEPRLYGIRVTKDWNGGPWWTGASPGHEGPFPLTVEIAGQIQRYDAGNSPVVPAFRSDVAPELDVFGGSQNNDYDTGDGRSVKLTYRPGGGVWTVSAAARFGRTNGVGPDVRAEYQTEPVCIVGGFYAAYCPYYVDDPDIYVSATAWSAESSRFREQHDIVDFAVGRDFGLGSLARSRVSLGVRYAQFQSATTTETSVLTNWDIPPGFTYPVALPVRHDRFDATLMAEREFEGAGPVVTWEASHHLFGSDGAGYVDLDWSASAGVLFGDQKHTLTGTEERKAYETSAFGFADVALRWSRPDDIDVTPVAASRSGSATVPTLSAGLGLSYSIDRVSIGAGYRWERYFDVLDGGALERRREDRTIDGPYFKLSVGFGG